jgi:DNA modification methylase
VRKAKQKKWTENEIRQLPDNELVGLSLNKAQPEEVQRLAAMHVRARQVKDLIKVEPIDHAVVAEPHTPIYRMHRYWARRPWSVFNELILHYSNPGSIILDPFCGGGVTVVEGVRLGRKVIGVDFNPLATFVTRMELEICEDAELDNALERLGSAVASDIEELYRTRCPSCKGSALANWVEHSLIHVCGGCHTEVVVSQAEKIVGKSVGAASAGYRCPKCARPLEPRRDKDAERRIVAVHFTCQTCQASGLKEPDAEDFAAERNASERCAALADSRPSLVPHEAFPDGYFQKHYSYYQRGFRKMADFFTPRNLLANGLLREALKGGTCPAATRRALVLMFSASLRFTNVMVFRNPGWQGGNPIEWAGNMYWVPDVNIEQNVWRAFEGRQRAIRLALRWGQEHFQSRKQAGCLEDLRKGDATHWVITCSSESLPLSRGSVDVVVTDPPYGWSVQYAELSDLWTVWLKDLGVLDGEGLTDGLVDGSREAIQTPAMGFPMAKSLSHYREMLLQIFRECHRVLKPNGWMVMTFHNREFKVWNAIHAAAHDAGFVMPEHDGLIYQPPIQNYTQTIQLRRRGSMLGDFIVSFKRVEAAPERRMIPEVEIGSKVRKVAEETVAYHGSASLSTIYMRLIPFLINSNLLERVQEKDTVQFLTDDFETRRDEEGNERWYFKEKPAMATAPGRLDFVPVEARIEYVVRSLLRQTGGATQDDVLNAVYTQLINSNAAEYQEIQRVLQRICVLKRVKGKTRPAYVLKEKAEEQKVLELFEREQPAVAQQQRGTRAESEHDLVIEDLTRLGVARAYEIHIGRNEQAKYMQFRKWSKAMTYPAEFGIHPDAFDRITQIDALWLRGNNIVSAFEVEKSTTIDSGINRFRELFAATPNLTVPAYLVVPDDRVEETQRKLGSLANRRDSITSKVRYLLFSDIMGKASVEVEAVARQVA